MATRPVATMTAASASVCVSTEAEAQFVISCGRRGSAGSNAHQVGVASHCNCRPWFLRISSGCFPVRGIQCVVFDGAFFEVSYATGLLFCCTRACLCALHEHFSFKLHAKRWNRSPWHAADTVRANKNDDKTCVQSWRIVRRGSARSDMQFRSTHQYPWLLPQWSNEPAPRNRPNTCRHIQGPPELTAAGQNTGSNGQIASGCECWETHTARGSAQTRMQERTAALLRVVCPM